MSTTRDADWGLDRPLHLSIQRQTHSIVNQVDDIASSRRLRLLGTKDRTEKDRPIPRQPPPPPPTTTLALKKRLKTMSLALEGARAAQAAAEAENSRLKASMNALRDSLSTRDSQLLAAQRKLMTRSAKTPESEESTKLRSVIASLQAENERLSAASQSSSLAAEQHYAEATALRSVLDHHNVREPPESPDRMSQASLLSRLEELESQHRHDRRALEVAYSQVSRSNQLVAQRDCQILALRDELIAASARVDQAVALSAQQSGSGHVASLVRSTTSAKMRQLEDLTAANGELVRALQEALESLDRATQDAQLAQTAHDEAERRSQRLSRQVADMESAMGEQSRAHQVDKAMLEGAVNTQGQGIEQSLKEAMQRVEVAEARASSAAEKEAEIISLRDRLSGAQTRIEELESRESSWAAVLAGSGAREFVARNESRPSRPAQGCTSVGVDTSSLIVMKEDEREDRRDRLITRLRAQVLSAEASARAATLALERQSKVNPAQDVGRLRGELSIARAALRSAGIRATAADDSLDLSVSVVAPPQPPALSAEIERQLKALSDARAELIELHEQARAVQEAAARESAANAMGRGDVDALRSELAAREHRIADSRNRLAKVRAAAEEAEAGRAAAESEARLLKSRVEVAERRAKVAEGTGGASAEARRLNNELTVVSASLREARAESEGLRRQIGALRAAAKSATADADAAQGRVVALEQAWHSAQKELAVAAERMKHAQSTIARLEETHARPEPPQPEQPPDRPQPLHSVISSLETHEALRREALKDMAQRHAVAVQSPARPDAALDLLLSLNEEEPGVRKHHLHCGCEACKGGGSGR